MKNDALNYQPWINGTYFLSEIVNAKPSWRLKDNSNGYNKAIWYVPKYDDWAIGPLENIGTTTRALTSFGGQGSFDIFNVPNDKWNVWNNNDKVWTQTGVGDVAIQCKGKIKSYTEKDSLGYQ